MSYRKAMLISAVIVAFLIPAGLSFAQTPPGGAADNFMVKNSRHAL